MSTSSLFTPDNGAMTVQIIEDGLVLVELSLRDSDHQPSISLPNGRISFSYIEEAVKIFSIHRLNMQWELERQSF